jgi:hypothetical protein
VVVSVVGVRRVRPKLANSMHLIFERSNGRFKSNCNILALAWMPHYNESTFRRAHLEYHHSLLAHLTGPAQVGAAAAGRHTTDAADSLSSLNNNNSNNSDSNINQHGIQELIRQHASRNDATSAQERNGTRPAADPGTPLQAGPHRRAPPFGTDPSNGPAAASVDLELILAKKKLANSRLFEQYQRYAYMRFGRAAHHQPAAASFHGAQSTRPTRNGAEPQAASESSSVELSNSAINDYIDQQYGRMNDFGWLAIGNIGRIVGVTLTSIVQQPNEIDGRKTGQQSQGRSNGCRPPSDDLIVLDDDQEEAGVGQADKYQQRQPARETSATIAAASQQQTTRPDRKSARSNHNLRGHLDEIILVKWNELYQKLASVDSKGNVLIWSKSNDKFTIQTPFYNKSKSVADFKWSNDGKTALICYTDSFILVGGSSGQRHWHSMLNLDDYHITCATWAPSDEQLLLGVSNGNIVVIDLPTSELTELVVGQANIRTMCWSSCEINLRHLDGGSSSLDEGGGGAAGGHCEPLASRLQSSGSPTSQEQQLQLQQGQHHTSSSSSSSLSSPPPPPARSFLPPKSGSSREENVQQSRHHHHQQQQQLGSAVVNRRRLSRNCALFCRYRPQAAAAVSNRDCFARPASASLANQPPAPAEFRTRVSSGQQHGTSDILAIDFADNTIKLFNGGLDDPKPREIRVNLESYLMAWSSDGRILAVAGFNIYTSAPSVGYLRCKYLNSIKFYNQKGDLVYERKINFTRYPITALTWAHDDKRLFVATGPRLHCAKVYMGIPKLSLLSLSCLHRHTKLMDKADVIKSLVDNKQLVANVLNWQSFNCPLDLGSSLIDSATTQPNETKRLLSECNQKSDSSASYSEKSSVVRLANTTRMIMSSDEPGSGYESDANERTKLMNNINIANYQLPAKLKSRIDQLFLQTIRQPYDEQLTLNDIAWLVPKNQQRYYCTMICYTHELADVGCIGHQYKAQELIANQRSGSSGPDGRDSDQFKVFIMYAEFQGSLIPILKARRIGFLKPEFVLFDPEELPSSYQRNHKVSDVSNSQASQSRASRHSPSNRRAAADQRFRQQRLQTGGADSLLDNNNCAGLHGAFHEYESGRPVQSDLEHNSRFSPFMSTNHHHQSLLEQVRSSRATPTASQLSMSSSSGARNGAFQAANARPAIHDPQLVYLLNLNQQKASGHHRQPPITSSKLLLQHEILKALERQQVRISRANNSATAASNNRSACSPGAGAGSQIGMRSLPENNELIRIKSNIWGTKFKLINMGNRKIGQRAILGSVKYKASLLHLQPRQIYLSLKDMSNYCVLCSMHHHTRLPQKRSLGKKSSSSSTANNAKDVPSVGKNSVSLLDLPITSSQPSTPARSASRRHSRCKHRFGQPFRSTAADEAANEKVNLPVGDVIRIAPKLEPNQKYKFVAKCLTDPSTSPNSAISSKSLTHKSHASIRSDSNARKRKAQMSAREPKAGTESDLVPVRSQQPTSSLASDEDSDILTLSLDQADQVRVEMSSNRARCSSLESRPTNRRPDHVSNELKMDEFLQANKTLKSIQTITKMIVDLSSRAQDDNNESAGRTPEPMDADQSSPVKLLKTDKGIGAAAPRSPARQYIPPDTPVHRPRRFASSASSGGGSALGRPQRAQSASSTPLAGAVSEVRRSHRNTNEYKSLSLRRDDDPLPPPPPSAPFRRKLSNSAKRLFDGSLRSFSGFGGGSGQTGAGYLTSDDPDSEECEALVVGRREGGNRFKLKLNQRHHQSQPCTPLKTTLATSGCGRNDALFRAKNSPKKQSSIDLASLRSQVVQKLRQSTSWMSSSRGLDDDSGSRSRLASYRTARSGNDRHARSKSCTKRSSWVHRGADSTGEPNLEGRPASALHGSSSSASSASSSSDDLISLIPSSSGSMSSSSSSLSSSVHSMSSDDSANEDFSFLDQALRAKLFKRSSKLSSSAREFGELDGKRVAAASSTSRRLGVDLLRRANKKIDGGLGPAHEQSRPKRRRRRRQLRNKRSICQNANCCCGRELKMSNRPPVWNEFSQVYQLDFGGRVTQESAKNLQIDYDGSLVSVCPKIYILNYISWPSYPALTSRPIGAFACITMSVS